MTAATPEERLAAIQVALQAQELPRAVALAREALDAGVEHALPLNLRAYWHGSEGRGAAALADLERAQRLAPDDIPVLNALGLAYARLGRMGEAAQTFGRIIAQDESFAPAHFNRGWTSEDLGELDIARHCYERAAALTPTAPDPPARLAALAGRLGDWPAARAHAARALALQPGHPLATIALAEAEIADRAFASAEQRLKALLTGPQISPDDLARAEGTLADLLDARGRHDEAFAAYTRRNEILRHLHRARFTGPQVETMPQYLSWLAAAFARLALAARAERPTTSANDTMGHVFVLGFARSGTTLLEEVLSRDPSVVTTQERDAMSDSVREFLVTPDGLRRLGLASEATLADWRALYWRRIAELGLETKDRVVVDKQPFNTYKLPLIARLFPGAKIVFSVRDPRDVVLSCFRRQFRLNPSTYEFLTLEGTARLYNTTMEISEAFRSRLALDVMELRHEDLVTTFDERMAAVCAFTGLAWSDALRDVAAPPGRRAVATPSSAQLRRGLNSSGIGQWRNYRAQLAPVLPQLEPWIARFGYRLD